MLLSRYILSEFEPRTWAQHLADADEYLSASPSDRIDLFKEKGARFYELARLPYFDPIRMTIIDPMHNLLLGWSFFLLLVLILTRLVLGVVKEQWLKAWIKTRCIRPDTEGGTERELSYVHAILGSVSCLYQMPR